MLFSVSWIISMHEFACKKIGKNCLSKIYCVHAVIVLFLPSKIIIERLQDNELG